jgi:hypothetical protein
MLPNVPKHTLGDFVLPFYLVVFLIVNCFPLFLPFVVDGVKKREDFILFVDFLAAYDILKTVRELIINLNGCMTSQLINEKLCYNYNFLVFFRRVL